jgi:hypothetical protein
MAPENNDREWLGSSCPMLASVMREAGVRNASIYAAEHPFFIVHRAAAQTVHDLGFSFRKACWKPGLNVPVAVLLAYTMQMLCGDPRKHVVNA